jgi:large conductance mechanosensitive channel
MWQDFKDFANRGRIFDMAVGIIIGAAFTAVVNSLVDDIIMPPIGMLLGQVDFSNMYITLQHGDPMGPYASLEEATIAGAVTINYGVFITSIITFLIVALVVFLLIRGINQVQEELFEPEEPQAPTTKKCPYCISEIHIDASRCPNCTSEI